MPLLMRFGAVGFRQCSVTFLLPSQMLLRVVKVSQLSVTPGWALPAWTARAYVPGLTSQGLAFSGKHFSQPCIIYTWKARGAGNTEKNVLASSMPEDASTINIDIIM